MTRAASDTRRGITAEGSQHMYGDRVHIVDDGWTSAALAKMSAPECSHSELVQIVRAVTSRIATEAFGCELPRTERLVRTRMAE